MQSAFPSPSQFGTGTATTSKDGPGIGLMQDWGQMEKSTRRRFDHFWTRVNANRLFWQARRFTRTGIK